MEEQGTGESEQGKANTIELPNKAKEGEGKRKAERRNDFVDGRCFFEKQSVEVILDFHFLFLIITSIFVIISLFVFQDIGSDRLVVAVVTVVVVVLLAHMFGVSRCLEECLRPIVGHFHRRVVGGIELSFVERQVLILIDRESIGFVQIVW